MNFYVVTYRGPFGFIKPWTAVRDAETYSQQFLTPSIIKGIELKLFPQLLNENNFTPGVLKIARHRLSYENIDVQQEVTKAKIFKSSVSHNGAVKQNSAIINRGILINPLLSLAFTDKESAETAFKQHICLTRNEDILLPYEEIVQLTEEEFNRLDGFELRFEKTENAFLVGFNRFENAKPMYGWLEIVGKAIRNV